MLCRPYLVLIVTALAASSALAEETAESLLRQSIAYHDPAGVWSQRSYALEIAESRPDGSERSTRVVLDGGGATFRYSAERQGRLVEAEVVGEECTATLDGSTDISSADTAELGLSCERLVRMRNYYSYLWGLPMKLRDRGTVLSPEVSTTSFLGRDVLALRVTYDDSVGSDTWYFYLDPTSRALVGYRFYHDEQANDGEYIVLEDEVDSAGVRLPKRRTWYTNADGELLGTDTLVGLERLD